MGFHLGILFDERCTHRIFLFLFLFFFSLGASNEEAGDNARDLARLTAAVVLAGEISLMSALASNHLVSAHMKLNR